MARQGLYRGFSSRDYVQTKTFALADLDLVKRDLMNHIYTKKGSRRMMAAYGTIIPDVPFEMLTDSLVEKIISDLERVYDMDPRVENIRIDVDQAPDQNALVISSVLRYVELKVVDALVFTISMNG